MGLVGAVAGLTAAGYSYPRVAGSSAGAVVAALVAAGASSERLERLVRGLDVRRLRDRSALARVPVVGPALSILVRDGVYTGDYLREWLGNELADLGVETFADLRYDDPGADPGIPPEHRFRLVVTATDLTLGRLLRLPWDYRSVFGRDPAGERVVDAVAASTALPFVYRPASVTEVGGRRHQLVDGGVLSNFPIETFDRRDGQPPRWPTFGVGLTSPGYGSLLPRGLPWPPPVRLLDRLIITLVTGRDAAQLADPCVARRVFVVDADDVGLLDAPTPAQVEALDRAGRAAAAAFLARWDWAAYLAGPCAARPAPP